MKTLHTRNCQLLSLHLIKNLAPFSQLDHAKEHAQYYQFNYDHIVFRNFRIMGKLRFLQFLKQSIQAS